MTTAVWFEPLRLADSANLRACGIQIGDASSTTSLREAVRQLLEICDHQACICGLSDNLQDVQAVAGIQVVDEASRRAILHIYTNELGLLPAVLKGIMHKTFWDIGLYRLECTIPADAESWLRVMRQMEFCEEGKLRNSAIDPLTGKHKDVLMYAMLRPEFAARGTAFIPFRLGVFAVTGHETALTEAFFVRYGERFESDYQHECAEMAGLLNEQGALANECFFTDLIKNHTSIVHANAPQPVLEAASQAQAYFAGNLPRFDLPVDLSRGSTFQTRVWEALKDIPYGSTWTYEELAYRLTAENWPAARNLARAVGSACGANPLPLIVPCHRVIGKDGRLVGFSGGLDIKEFLLDHEFIDQNNNK